MHSRSHPPPSASGRRERWFAKRQMRLNRATARRAALFASHRARVTEETLSLRPRHRGRLCVLGAGNCNDLNLGAVARAFSEVHLVDIDAGALDKAKAALEGPLSRKVFLHGGFDLSGLGEMLGRVRGRETPDLTVNELIRQARQSSGIDFRDIFDVILSSGLLTQLMNSVATAVGERHPRIHELFAAVRAGHLRFMAQSLASGGSGLLISDVASSETWPGLQSIPENELALFASQPAITRRFFAGVNPYDLRDQLRHDPWLARRIDHVEMKNPWLWRLSVRRTLLVYGFSFHRRSGALDPDLRVGGLFAS